MHTAAPSPEILSFAETKQAAEPLQPSNKANKHHPRCTHAQHKEEEPKKVQTDWMRCTRHTMLEQGLQQVAQLTQGSPMKLSPTEQSIRMRLRSATKGAPKRGSIFCPVCPHSP